MDISPETDSFVIYFKGHGIEVAQQTLTYQPKREEKILSSKGARDCIAFQFLTGSDFS